VAKKTEKELKQPDQFVTFWSKAGTWMAPRRKPLLMGLAALLGVLVVGWGAQVLLASRAERASTAFARIHQIATAPLLPATGDAKTEKTDPALDDGLPHFKTERERTEAALKEANAYLASHGGQLREEAMLLKARYLVALGRGDEAVPVYTELQGSLDDRLRFLAQEGLGYAQETAGQLDKAIAVFGGLADQAKSAGNFMRDRALFNKARLLEQKGAKQDAQKVYREILSEVPTSNLKTEINERLAILEGK
jgi:tetratricopeptide (TPR) repeat protein